MTGVLIRSRSKEDPERREGHRKTEAEPDIKEPQELREPPEARRGKEGLFPRAPAGA